MFVKRIAPFWNFSRQIKQCVTKTALKETITNIQAGSRLEETVADIRLETELEETVTNVRVGNKTERKR